MHWKVLVVDIGDDDNDGIENGYLMTRYIWLSDVVENELYETNVDYMDIIVSLAEGTDV